MSWPLLDNYNAPIVYVTEDGRLWYGHLIADWAGRPYASGGVYPTEENRGVVWARGWNTEEAHAFSVRASLMRT